MLQQGYSRDIVETFVFLLLLHTGRRCPKSVGSDPHCLAGRVQKFSGCEGKTTEFGERIAQISHQDGSLFTYEKLLLAHF